MKNLKKCYKCKEQLHIRFFNKNARRSDGFQSQCKECQKEISRFYYKNNRKTLINKITANKRKRALNNYIKIVTEYFSKPCTDCRKNFHPASMVFDHTGIDKKHKFIKAEGVLKLVREGYSWKVISKEIQKCELRCQNCHHYKTSKERNYWEEIKDLIEDFFSLTKKINLVYSTSLLDDYSYNKKKKELNSKYKKLMRVRVERISLQNK